MPGEVISTATASDVAEHMVCYEDLLIDAVDTGASIGFLAPIERADATAYWMDVARSVGEGHRLLLACMGGDTLLGAVQVELPTMPNAAHRAEVAKLMVHRSARRRGLGRSLMVAAERAAARLGKSLIVLDTRRGDDAERLYRKMGYVEAGVIPRYARSSAGMLEDTVYFYKNIPRPNRD